MAYLNKVEMKQYLSNALECIEFKLSKCQQLFNYQLCMHIAHINYFVFSSSFLYFI